MPSSTIFRLAMLSGILESVSLLAAAIRESSLLPVMCVPIPLKNDERLEVNVGDQGDTD